MVEIAFLTPSDRDSWEALARGKDEYFDVDRTPDDYDDTWRRLLAGQPTRGIAARLDGAMVGVAHYVFHASIWGAGRCYLADLYVADEARRKGIATAMIRWLAQDAHDHGYPRLYWNTLADAPARALYDTVGTFLDDFVTYTYGPPSPDPEPGER